MGRTETLNSPPNSNRSTNGGFTTVIIDKGKQPTKEVLEQFATAGPDGLLLKHSAELVNEDPAVADITKPQVEAPTEGNWETKPNPEGVVRCRNGITESHWISTEDAHKI